MVAGADRRSKRATLLAICRVHISVGLVERLRRLAFAVGVLRRPSPPALPLLEYVDGTDETEWLRNSLTTIAEHVASILPGDFEAYVRIYHPFVSQGQLHALSWRELAARAGKELRDPADAADFALFGVANAQALTGSLPPSLIDVLVEHLGMATTTPGSCYFALWDGHGGTVVHDDLETTLHLLHRNYHVFAGPVEAARTSYADVSFVHQSANLWWPADRAWCVATEVDFAWTYVGGTRALIDALLADPRLDAVETTAAARW